MNLLRGIFVSTLPGIAFVFTVLSGWRLAQSGFDLVNLGTLISSLTIVLVFASIFIVPRARTGEYLMGYSFFVVLGFVISLVGVLQDQPASWISIWSAATMVLLWWLYVSWYSAFQNRDKSKIVEGNSLPRFSLVALDGSKVESTELLDAPRIWMFYRGNWCPLCMAQINEISQLYKDIEARGAKVALVSPQPHKFTRGLARKHNVNFEFYRDDDYSAAKSLGIYAKNGTATAMVALGYELDTVMPTIVISDIGGKVIYADLTDNYRVRPEPQEFIRILDQHKEKRA